MKSPVKVFSDIFYLFADARRVRVLRFLSLETARPQFTTVGPIELDGMKVAEKSLSIFQPWETVKFKTLSMARSQFLVGSHLERIAIFGGTLSSSKERIERPADWTGGNFKMKATIVHPPITFVRDSLPLGESLKGAGPTSFGLNGPGERQIHTRQLKTLGADRGLKIESISIDDFYLTRSLNKSWLQAP